MVEDGEESTDVPASPDLPPIPLATNGLEGLTLDRLPIELVRADMRKWISLEQVLENVRTALRKKHEWAGMGFEANAYDEFYAEGQRTDDCYGDDDSHEEKRDQPKEAIPVVITKSDGELVNAYIYVSLVASVDIHVALSIVPNTSELGASF
ncbi:hypothetical protein L873DRAFT_1792265 [Choiromyces venosus 120613-1]|uniref:Uncharacterized protein n=1 Tax=Choiromyces venosus 120613-1 TaxID=1336337 RepID=A0A3N4JBC4_9PEZI|nr:hypothetical protein L873DRAFT_1792265 [Choiromyces venosus 120613-1]